MTNHALSFATPQTGAGGTKALAVQCPHFPVIAPAWLWRKLASRGVNMQSLRAAELMKHLSHDELAEWQLTAQIAGSLLGSAGLFMTDIVEYSDPSEADTLQDILRSRLSNDMLEKSLTRKLAEPSGSDSDYQIVLTPGYMWVLVEKGILYNVGLDPALKTSLLEDVISRHLTMMPVDEISKLNYFKNYVSGISAGA